MRSHENRRWRELDVLVSHGKTAIDEGRFADARQALLEAKKVAARRGVTSAFVEWGLAIASDRMGETEMAFEYIVNAVRVDPLHAGFQGSFNVIVTNLRAALCDPSRVAEDPATPKLYELLTSVGETDVPCHLAMARFLAATGSPHEAMKLCEAVTLLASTSRDAWLTKASVARALGDTDQAARCEAEAAGIAQAQIPFGIPAPPGGACA